MYLVEGTVRTWLPAKDEWADAVQCGYGEQYKLSMEDKHKIQEMIGKGGDGKDNDDDARKAKEFGIQMKEYLVHLNSRVDSIVDFGIGSSDNESVETGDVDDLEQLSESTTNYAPIFTKKLVILTTNAQLIERSLNELVKENNLWVWVSICSC